MNKKMKFKACEGFKTATDAACESRECLNSMPSCEEEKPLLWVNLLGVNEDFEDKCNTEICFLVIHYINVPATFPFVSCEPSPYPQAHGSLFPNRGQ